MQRKMQMPKVTERKKQKKCNFQRCIFSVAFFCNLRRCIFSVASFCNFDQLLHFLRKKTKKSKKMQQHQNECNGKCEKRQLPTLHFLSCFFFNLRRRIFLDVFFLFETCDIAFSNLFVFGKLLQQATHLGDGKLRKNHSQKNAVPRHGLEPASRIFHSSGQGKKKLHGYFSSCFLNTSSTAQGGGGSFKNRKPIGEIGCCESGMAERIH